MMRMNLNRFEALCEAFGADVGRWPAPDRDAALRWAANDPATSERMLADAARLDQILNAAVLPAPSRELFQRVIAGAPRARRLSHPLAWRWLAGAGVGAALAAACAAGVATGVMLAPATLARVHIAWSFDSGDEAFRLLREPRDLAEG